MLNSKRDESIKRYLSKVGELKIKSKIYSSRYYQISYDECEITIRFSDHFSVRPKGKNTPDIDIIKTSVGFYVLKTLSGTSATLGEDTILPYLKSLLLVFPEITKTIDSFRMVAESSEKVAKQANLKYKELKDLYDQKTEEFQLADQIWEENKQLKQINENLNQALDECSIIKQKFNGLKKKYDNLAKLINKLKKISAKYDIE